MKKLVLALAAASALAAAAVPAAAQPYGGWPDRQDRHDRYDRYDRGDRGQLADRLAWRVERAERSGQIDRRYAGYLRSQVGAAVTLSHRYRADGRYTAWERRDIQNRLSAVETRLDRATSRNYGYGYGDYRR